MLLPQVEPVADRKPFSFQFIVERWVDGLKVVGAGNGAGLLASAASIQFFDEKPELLSSIKVGAAFFLAGIFSFAFAFMILTLLPLAFERFLSSSKKTFRSFQAMVMAFQANKLDARVYAGLVLFSLASWLFFLGGCFQAMFVVMNF